MNIMTKVLIGAAATAVVGTVIAVATKEEKSQEVTDNSGNVVAFMDKEGNYVKKEDAGVIARIKRFVKRKVIKFLAWVALHMEQIEAAGAIIGLAGSVISIGGAIKEFKNGTDTEKQLKEINEKLDAIEDRERLTNRVINHNTHVFGVAVDHISEKVGVDADELKKDLDAVSANYPDLKKLVEA